MHTKIHWITDSFGTMPRPRGKDWLEGEIIEFKRQDLSALVSLLENVEAVELGLELEQHYSTKNGIEFLSYPIADYTVPRDFAHFEQFIDTLMERINQGGRVAIHCRAGIGRSTIVACSILLKKGFSTEDALQLISKKRGLAVPDTKEQVDWLKKFEKWIEKTVSS